MSITWATHLLVVPIRVLDLVLRFRTSKGISYPSSLTLPDGRADWTQVIWMDCQPPAFEWFLLPEAHDGGREEISRHHDRYSVHEDRLEACELFARQAEAIGCVVLE